jgi:hypothetical protein
MRHRPALQVTAVILLSMASPGRPEEVFSFASVVPADALLYIEARDLESLKKGLDQTPLGAVIATENPGAGAGLLLNLLRFGLKVYSGAPLEQWSGHLDGSVALVLLPLTEKPGPVGPPVIFLAKLRNGPEFRRFLDTAAIPSLLDVAPHIELETEPVGQYTLEKIRDTRKKEALHFAILDNLAVIGNAPGLRRFLTGYKVGPVLAESENYVAALKKAAPEGQLRAYFNAAQTLRPFLEAAERLPDGKRKSQIAGLPSLGEVAGSLRYEAGAAKERIFLRRSPAEPTGIALAFIQPKPRPLEGAKFVSPAYPLYVSVNLESGPAFRQAVQNTVRNVIGEEAAAQMEQGRQFLEQTLNVNLEQEIWANLTGEAVFAMDIPRLKESLLENAELPPKAKWSFLFGLSIQNRDILWNAFKKALGSQAALDQGYVHETAEKDEAQLITAKRRGRSMTFAFLPDFLVFSESADMVAAALKARAEKKSLADDPAFKERLALHPEGQNLVVHFDVRRVTSDLSQVLAQFAHPAGALALKEFEPVIRELRPATAVGAVQQDGFALDAYSSEGLALHFLSVGVLIDALKKSPGMRAVRAKRDMERITVAIDSYFIDNGTFPPTLEALTPKYMRQVPNDPFGWKPYRYHPGPVTKEDERELHTTIWLLVGLGPDLQEDIPVKEVDPLALQKRLNSSTPEDEDYLRKVTYRYRPDKYRLEDRILDRGDIYVIGTPPR